MSEKKNDEKIKTPKSLKKVQFNEETVDNEKLKKTKLTPYKKGWHTKLQADGQPFIKGSFTEKELKILKHAICQFVSDENLGIDGLKKLICEKNDSSTRGMWTKISLSLPNRSVKSCHDIARSQFNPLNHKGKWTKEEEIRLLDLVDKNGRKWELIGEELERTAMNVRDKYKLLGEEMHEFRDPLNWTTEEIIKMLKLIQKRIKVKFLDENIEEKVKNDLEKGKTNELKRKRKRDQFDKNMAKKIRKGEVGGLSKIKLLALVVKYIDFEKIKTIEFKDINWTKIANRLKTKSKDDCRNKWLSNIQNTIVENLDSDEEEGDNLIENIISQNIESDSEINWENINNGCSAKVNQFKWNNIKKRVTSRGFISCNEILNRLSKALKKKKQLKKEAKEERKEVKEEESIFDLFKSEYK